jgi:ATP:corrinoid adenosyltransferase
MIYFQLFEHALIAAAIQTVVGLLTRQWCAGGALASCYFIGREVAQAEYRWIEAFGGGLRANMPWHAMFDPRVWQTPDQTADWLGPVVLTTAISLSVHAAKRRTQHASSSSLQS